MGPTAAGKTGLAVELAEHHGYEIISVDSALVYQSMDIGTAKPDAATLARAPHKLIDILDPLESYSAADFVRDAVKQIEETLASGKKPLLVGGTMMYFNALLKGLAIMPEADPATRKALEDEAALYGWEHLHQELQQVDPISATRIHPNDPQRLQRALEVYRISGRSMTELWAEQQQQEARFDFINLAVMPAQRSLLHERIEQRFDLMLQQDFVGEVEALYNRGDLHLGLPSMRCVGYRQLWCHLAGEYDLEEARYKGIVATRQLAKRQITWLRGWQDLKTLDTLDESLLPKALKYL
ncbi:tRNA (adenosine(37)-N6)-dimethylallyltransferase MiaA [Marinomonas agarivorans]|nr:tRNA (adenosine(37)-N6)-dimethylallyltransferase MiaA [Marinomonas agarivorans]